MDAKKDPKRPDVPKLTPGSRYRVLSMMTRDEPLTSEGEFKGYTTIAGADAICMELEERGDDPRVAGGEKARKKVGKFLRLVPGQMIIAVDIIDQAKEKEEEKSHPDSRAYQ